MMSIRLLNNVLDDPTAEGHAKAILMFLAYKADDSGRVWVSSETIKQKLGIHRTTVFRCLKKLEELGCLKRESKAGQYGNNRYTVQTQSNHLDSSEERQLQSQRATVAESDSSQELRCTVAESDSYSSEELHNRPIDPIKTLKKSKPKKDEHDEWVDDWFENQFWKPFPPRRKNDKAKCKTFVRNLLSKKSEAKELARQITDALNKFKNHRDWKKQGGEFTPMPYTWLNNRRWEHPPEKIEPVSVGSVETNYKTDSPLELTTDPIADLERFERLQAEGRRVPQWKIEATKKQIEEMKAEGATK